MHALRERGVEYVEVRLMDLDPFKPVGITAADDALPRHVPAALPARESPPDTPQELEVIGAQQAARRAGGREPALRLRRGDASHASRMGQGSARRSASRSPPSSSRAAAARVIAMPSPAATCVLGDPDTSPVRARPARDGAQPRQLVRAFRARRVARAPRHPDRHPAAGRGRGTLREAHAESIEKQRKIEASDHIDFETYRQRYLNPELLQAVALEK